MLELLDVAIPAVVLIPLVIVGVSAWICFKQSVESNKVRRAEFRRLHRLAVEEHERAERELEHDYMRQRQAGVYSTDYRRRDAAEYDYKNRAELEQQQWKQTDAELRWRKQAEEEQRRKQAGVEEQRRRQAEVSLLRKQAEEEEQRRKQVEFEEHRRRQAEAEEQRRKQAEEEENRRKQAEAEEQRKKQAEEEEKRRKQAEAEDRRRREAVEEEIKRRQAEEQEKKRQAEVEAQARKQAEEEGRRKQAEDETNQKGQEDDARRHEAVKKLEKKGHPVSNLKCIVCQQPTKRRCSRCKSVFYCSRGCQVQHWSKGHKYDCGPQHASSSSGSVAGDNGNFSNGLSPRSFRSEKNMLGADDIAPPSLSPAISPAPSYATFAAISHSAPASPQPGSLLKTSSTVSADGRRMKPKKFDD